ncbi:hypothetical protein G772_02523 [Escherichia coli HVH 111 (4-7039018)]|nr:hypothetical protein G772_02523 [Escherichia coli HVH 111 (4-7039018)]
MPFARYFCIFINVGLGEGSALPVGAPAPQLPDIPTTVWLNSVPADLTSEDGLDLQRAHMADPLPSLGGVIIFARADSSGCDTGFSTQGCTPATFNVRDLHDAGDNQVHINFNSSIAVAGVDAVFIALDS